jgi:N-acetyl-gamma-glutamyl-phosphate reductase
MRVSFTVAVAGASGYAGGEVLRILAAHPEAAIGALTAHGRAGEPLGAVHPHLASLADRELLPTTPEALAGHDAVVLALPHGASGALAAKLPAETLVIDCGADHRLEREGDWTAFYGGDYAGAWAYGMPELLLGSERWVPGAGRGGRGPARQREALRGAKRVAVPGCNATAVTLALQPAISSLAAEPRDLVAVLACGLSGAGRALKTHLLASEVMGSASPYAVGGGHRHIPEILQNLRHAGGGAGASISFTPTLVPMSRGILATCVARAAPGLTLPLLRAAYERAYGAEAFVDLLPEGAWPATASVLGSNACQVGVGIDRAAGRVVAVAAIDNLGKGTAGAAVQCLNLALDLPEGAGLTANGVAP